jgi:hypothetical protein
MYEQNFFEKSTCKSLVLSFYRNERCSIFYRIRRSAVPQEKILETAEHRNFVVVWLIN